MQFEHFLDHSAYWPEDEDFSVDFKQFIQHIQTFTPDNMLWQDRVFQCGRPLTNHCVKLTVKTPFNSIHFAKLKFNCFQPTDPYSRKLNGYFFSYKLDHDAFLARGERKIKGNLNANDPYSAVELSALTYHNALTQWLNRVYIQVIEEK